MTHMIDEPIEEELLPGNRLKYMHPTQPGEILDGRFKPITKLGFGTDSTVWLAENLNLRGKSLVSRRYVSIKITALDAYGSQEINSKLISTAQTSSHEGIDLIRTPIDKFQLKGPEGTHVCLVYEIMRETLFEFRHRMLRKKLELPLFRLYIYSLLVALDCLHTECRLIHTDIKEKNIMITLENNDVVANFVDFYKEEPLSKHVRTEDGRATYLSRNYFGSLQGSKLVPMLSDFDCAAPFLDNDYGHVWPIQSHCFRAPEVLLGCPWTYSVDIWNLGLLMWNLLEDVTLFDRPAGKDGEDYDAHIHLAQMASLLGDPPDDLIIRERYFSQFRLGGPIMNLRGKECMTMNEFWGGPFFNDDNQLLCRDLLKGGKKLADTVTELTGSEKEAFLDLASIMLQWLPEKRTTAKELMEHPFFESVNKSRTKYYENFFV
ncbi:kinase domain protein [Hypoxylon argillaceum]|nr:kinase domain protein [Hypoxylon argillaceum]